MSDNPFDPPGVVWRQLEPQFVTVRLLGAAIGLLPFLIASILAAVIWTSPGTLLLAVGVLVLGGWLAWVTPRRVKARAYAIRDRDLFVKSGIMVRSLTIAPYVRIQTVEIHVGPIERAFGLATLTISTASPTLTVSLPGITPALAAELRDLLTHRDTLLGYPQAPTTPSTEALVVDHGGQPSPVVDYPRTTVPVATSAPPSNFPTPTNPPAPAYPATPAYPPPDSPSFLPPGQP